MVKVSNRTRFAAGNFGKIVLAILVSVVVIVAIILALYKPVYSVSINGDFKGYVSSKVKLQQDIEEFMRKGDSDRVGYILLNDRPDYGFSLVKKDTVTKDEEVLALVKSSCDIYYKVYAINVNDEEVCLIESLADAQKIVDELNEKQESYIKKATIVISEKYEKEYDAEADIKLATSNILKPITVANEKAVAEARKVEAAARHSYDTTYATKTTVSQEVLNALLQSEAPTDFGLPVTGYVVTSRYGWRRSGYHTGTDYAVPMGTPIHVIEDGVVTHAAWTGNYGYLVKVQHTGGVETYYAHCSRFACNVGDEVKKGDVIAYVGSTGNSTGPHVHLEIRYNGSTVDPQELIEK